MQARGENLISILKAFTSSSKLKVASERKSLDMDANRDMVERAVFFDYLTLFMVGAFDSVHHFFIACLQSLDKLKSRNLSGVLSKKSGHGTAQHSSRVVLFCSHLLVYAGPWDTPFVINLLGIFER